MKLEKNRQLESLIVRLILLLPVCVFPLGAPLQWEQQPCQEVICLILP